MTRSILSRTLLPALFMALPGLAPGVALAADDEARIAVLAAACANCHGTDGVGAPPMLPLAGRAEDLLAQQLLAFRSGEAPEPTVMDRLARGYTEDELRALARHFASLAPEVSR